MLNNRAGVVIVAVIITSLVVWVALCSRQDSTDDQGGLGKDDKSYTVSSSAPPKPELLETQSAYNSYVSEHTTGDIPLVESRNVHVINDVDWDDDVLVAFLLDTPSAQSFMGASLKAINGEKTYTISMMAQPAGCEMTADNVIRMVFVEQSDKQFDYPVEVRVHDNPNRCDG